MKYELTDKLSMLLGMSYALNKELYRYLKPDQKETFNLIENNIEDLFYPKKDRVINNE